jgi:exopolysaccharide biosynthesis polyprenyl glycosylphosphotransferase
MRRIVGLNLLPEILVLWAIETSAVFLAFYDLLRGNPYLSDEGAVFLPASYALVDAFLLAVTVGLVGVATGSYRLNAVAKTRLIVLQAVVSVALSVPAVWLVAKLFHINVSAMADRWPVRMFLAWLLLLFATRFLYRTALRMRLFVRRVAVLGASLEAKRMIDAIGDINSILYRIEVLDPSPANPSHANDKLRLPKGLWGVVLSRQDANVTIPLRTRRFDIGTFWEHQLGRIDVGSAAGLDETGAMAQSATAGTVRADATIAASASLPAAFVRRSFDIIFALLLLLLVAPLLVVTALLIRIESAGPIIYRQERVGLHGRIFTLWKFRSMRWDAEREGPIWAKLRDPRVTAVGGFIRLVRIDELPQLFNVLRGEMSLVGPRPERPHFVEQLSREIPPYQLRSCVKPGLTGWAQVSFPYGASVEDTRKKLSYDLYYVKHRSLLFDLMILMSTVRVILFQEGAR